MTKKQSLFECDNYLMDNGSGLYIQEYFHKVLAQERKRTDRSNDPFILILVDIRTVITENDKTRTIKKISGAISSCTRETDVKGWYEQDSVIGIICTEINGYKGQVFRERLIKKAEIVCGTKEASNIEVIWHIYPEGDGRNDDSDKKPNDSFYPDLKKKDISNKKLRIMKRTIDILGSLFCILLFLPFFIIIPLLIKLTSPGPVVFKQERMGLFGKRFQFLKFRSMKIENDDSIHKKYVKNLIRNESNGSKKDNGRGESEEIYKIKDDPRITRIGRILRRTSLDELPQFFNVLNGDMSLVGPRPPIPYELEDYQLWHRRRVIEIKPGITGIWQVYGRSKTTFDEMVRMDLEYIRKWTPMMDIKLLLKTPLAMINGKGAY